MVKNFGSMEILSKKDNHKVYRGGGTGPADQAAARPIIISKSQEKNKIND